MHTVEIDGSAGEGGGQILRSSLALAIVTGKPLRIGKIRAGRPKPGLMRQHLTAVQAAAKICGASVAGDSLRSTSLSFEPGRVVAGEYSFAVGTAGSAMLVLQTILLPLLMANGTSRVTLEGGTHNPFAPPFDFLAAAYLPLIRRMGPRVIATLKRPGFFPAGGGCAVFEIEPAGRLKPFDLLERGALKKRRARATVAHLPRHIAERELRIVQTHLGWEQSELEVCEAAESIGPGNTVSIALEYEHLTKVFTGFGEVGRSAEAVATEAVDECQSYLKAAAPVGKHLTDQVLLPLALAGGGMFRSTGLTPHSLTHMELIGRFLDVPIVTERLASGEAVVKLGTGA